MSQDRLFKQLSTSEQPVIPGIEVELAAYERLENMLQELGGDYTERFGADLHTLITGVENREDRAIELELLSETDPMTEISNERGFIKGADIVHRASLRALHEELGSSAVVRCGVMLMDLDKFKNINDTYGHDAGDRAIILAANALSLTAQRAEDKTQSVVARLGGDEFAGFMHVGSMNPMRDAMNFAGKAMYHLEEAVENDDEFRSIGLQGSFGVSTIEFDSGFSEDSLAIGLKKADLAMYRVKNGTARARIEFEH